jgi:hypothetical protein
MRIIIFAPYKKHKKIWVQNSRVLRACQLKRHVFSRSVASIRRAKFTVFCFRWSASLFPNHIATIPCASKMQFTKFSVAPTMCATWFESAKNIGFTERLMKSTSIP